MSRRSPQEKKTLSYEKDGRNTYGENDKASRKAIPLRKRLVNRANRHDEDRRLHGALGSPDEERSETAETGLLGRRPKVWRKSPDTPLGQSLADKRHQR